MSNNSNNSQSSSNTTSNNQSKDWYKDFLSGVKDYNPSYFDPIDPVHQNVIGSPDIVNSEPPPTFTYLVAISSII